MDDTRLSLPLLLGGGGHPLYENAGISQEAYLPVWALRQGKLVSQLASDWAKAGCQAVCAPTGAANGPLLDAQGSGLPGMRELNASLLELTKDGVVEQALVAGVLSDTGLDCEPYGEEELTSLISIYSHQASALAEAGADLLVIEGIRSLVECRAAVLGARRVQLPILVVLPSDDQGRTPWDEDLLACMVVLQDLGIHGFGVQTIPMDHLDGEKLDPERLIPVLERLAPYAKLPLVAFIEPNQLSPIQYAHQAARLMRRGVKVLGGMNASPSHLAALRHMMDTFDISRIKVAPADYELLAACKEVYFLGDDLEYSQPVECGLDMADTLMELCHENFDALLIQVDTPDDGYHFSLNAHLVDLPVAFESESLTALESALLHYPGKAIVVSTSCEIEREDLETVACKYGAIVL